MFSPSSTHQSAFNAFVRQHCRLSPMASCVNHSWSAWALNKIPRWDGWEVPFIRPCTSNVLVPFPTIMWDAMPNTYLLHTATYGLIRKKKKSWKVYRDKDRNWIDKEIMNGSQEGEERRIRNMWGETEDEWARRNLGLKGKEMTLKIKKILRRYVTDWQLSQCRD